MVEAPREGEAVRPFLAVAREAEQARIVLLAEELEGGRVFERMDGVFLGEAQGVGLFEAIEVLRDGVEERG